MYYIQLEYAIKAPKLLVRSSGDSRRGRGVYLDNGLSARLVVGSATRRPKDRSEYYRCRSGRISGLSALINEKYSELTGH